MNRIKDFSPRTAAVWFWSVTGFFAMVWVFLPALFHSAYRPDVLELQLIGKEWVLATRKHPMLPAWILEILNILTNRAFAAPFLAAQLCAVLSLWSIWSLGRKVLSEKLALTGTFAMLPYWYFTVESVKFNQNIALIAFWSLSVFLVFQAFQTNRPVFWTGGGLSLGLAFHAKYSAIFLVLAILLYMTVRPEGRKHWKTAGPYLTALTAFLVFLPHGIWLFQNSFTTLSYLQSRPVSHSTRLLHLVFPLKFLGNELLFWVCPLLVLVPALGFFRSWKLRKPETVRERECEKFLFYCFMIPLGLHLLISCVMRLKLLPDYGSVFWLFSGIWLLLRFQPRETPNLFSRTLKTLAAVELLLVCVFVFQTAFSSYCDAKPRRTHFPMRDLGAACDRIWDSRYSVPCPYLSGDWILAGNAAYAMKDHPSVHFYWENIGDLHAAPTGTWSADSDVNEQGGLILWNADRFSEKEIPAWLFKRFPSAEVLPETLVLPYKTGAKIPPLRVGVAVVPPK
ncbi:MAG: glycosyltransferase family 39 protein [Planctomycetaceae bacterium]|nr:glycosyltransferase family 39 protein [Planctomycetaceae bacterium]